MLTRAIRKSISAGLWSCLVMLFVPSQAASQQIKTAYARAPSIVKIAKQKRPYYIEFRSRSALSYGHTFAVIGRVGSKITADNVVGLHPFTESEVPWMIGHLIFVPSETGFSDGDIEDIYITARYRVNLTEAEYRKLVVDVEKMKADHPVWHAAIYNCNAFVGDIARSLGLKAPFSSWSLPKVYVTQLKELNNGVSQLPAAAVTALGSP